MSQNAPQPPASVSGNSDSLAAKIALWGSILASVALLVWFYGLEQRYGSTRGQSAFGWIYSAWNGETDYEHGLLFPFVIAGLVFYRLKDLKAEISQSSLWGLGAALVGVLLYIAAYRTLQPRIAMAGLPFILWGSAWYLWGWRVAGGTRCVLA